MDQVRSSIGADRTIASGGLDYIERMFDSGYHMLDGALKQGYQMKSVQVKMILLTDCSHGVKFSRN